MIKGIINQENKNEHQLIEKQVRTTHDELGAIVSTLKYVKNRKHVLGEREVVQSQDPKHQPTTNP